MKTENERDHREEGSNQWVMAEQKCEMTAGRWSSSSCTLLSVLVTDWLLVVWWKMMVMVGAHCVILLLAECMWEHYCNFIISDSKIPTCDYLWKLNWVNNQVDPLKEKKNQVDPWIYKISQICHQKFQNVYFILKFIKYQSNQLSSSIRLVC